VESNRESKIHIKESNEVIQYNRRQKGNEVDYQKTARQNRTAVVKDFCFVFGRLLVRFSARNYLLWNFPQTLPTNDG
jgi:hypothetical protein